MLHGQRRKGEHPWTSENAQVERLSNTGARLFMFKTLPDAPGCFSPFSLYPSLSLPARLSCPSLSPSQIYNSPVLQTAANITAKAHRAVLFPGWVLRGQKHNWDWTTWSQMAHLFLTPIAQGFAYHHPLGLWELCRPVWNQLSTEELEMGEMFFHHILCSQTHKDTDVLRPAPKSASVWLNTEPGKDVKHGWNVRSVKAGARKSLQECLVGLIFLFSFVLFPPHDFTWG